MFTSLEASELVNGLEHMPSVDLQAVSLLQAIHGDPSADGVFLTVSQETLTSAMRELIVYTKSCAVLVSKLQYLSAMVLSTVECTTWPL